VQVPLEVPGRPVLRPPPPGGDPDRDPDSTITVICTADGFDLGFAFDGDGDRVLAVDATGELVDGDFLIDQDPRREGLVVAAGGSGHAFKFAPLLGSMIADAVERREAVAIIGDYDGLAIRSATKATEKIIAAAGNLKVIGRAGIGVDTVDVKAATARGIVVMNTPYGNAITTAEHALSLMMALARNISQAANSMREGKWEKKKFQGTELFNKTLGIIGMGRIGTVVAERGLGLRMRVLCYDPFITKELAAKIGAESVSLDELLARSDFITIHTPKTKDTAKLLSKEAFMKMKPGVRLINCARGGIINEDALYEALAQLPDEQRETIVLHLKADMGFKQIAEMQNASYVAVQARYRRGMDKLRSILNGRL